MNSMKSSKTRASVTENSPGLPSGGWIALGAGIIVCAALAAYANSFRGPFIFDDLTSIPGNPTLRSLGQAWWPPKGQGALTVGGRPWLNFTLGINYAISALDVGSYHVANLLIHLSAGLALFGVVRRTLLRPPLAARFECDAGMLAFVIALLWTLHPLQTESVTYIVQRAESLMGLFFLLALYGFIRSVDSPRPWIWRVISVASCLLAVGSKEVGIMIPIIVFLYDRAFVSGDFREAWRRHRWHHLALLATWLPLFAFVASAGGNRQGVFHLSDIDMWLGHGLSQFEAIIRYLGLTFWPRPLVIDYGEFPFPGFATALPWALPVLALAAATLWALWRRPVIGFLGAWFFGILAPTCLLPATLQIIVEHRMYLPLAAVIALVVTGAYLLAGRRVMILFLGLALAAGWLTARRNDVYQSDLSLWGDTVAKRPLNEHARINYGIALTKAERAEEAAAQFKEAVRIQPNSLQAHNNLGNALVLAGQYDEAIVEYERVLRDRPGERGVQQNLEQARALQQYYRQHPKQ
ncbi:MAG TPA: tetratricopeptide repeat protein [Opitutaceae bacterium]|nr:tetratricopeptide repeat protein [Opitutaceae bacterium]